MTRVAITPRGLRGAPIVDRPIHAMRITDDDIARDARAHGDAPRLPATAGVYIAYGVGDGTMYEPIADSPWRYVATRALGMERRPDCSDRRHE